MIAASRFQAILLMLTALLLNGCFVSNISDLEQYIDEVLAKPGGRIEPLPEFKPYEAYTYQSAKLNLRDPFRLFYKKQVDADGLTASEDGESGLTEEMEAEITHRNKEDLEEFELDSLRMVGTIENGDYKWGIIKDPNGVIHTVKVGNYLGRNIGKILNVLENSVEIREIFKESNGRWEERQVMMVLNEQE